MILIFKMDKETTAYFEEFQDIRLRSKEIEITSTCALCVIRVTCPININIAGKGEVWGGLERNSMNETILPFKYLRSSK